MSDEQLFLLLSAWDSKNAKRLFDSLCFNHLTRLVLGKPW